ncbi:GNAT family N-acetyltransferase [Tepidiforma thermophila]|uniref:Putative acetyltransferase n=1 Tax=Tepidiforma thermophila (strain KCTC 52669 / CGMCC 1.13589 / G233) TaxID=2761530 RepID=A0A2A9HG46_TEPT2|nr:GNAT family N-acetyltransferase [Tepidiforma thermophila]PFG73789.1 putative acetyltransferase [Tepidiforma thermophila]
MAFDVRIPEPGELDELFAVNSFSFGMPPSAERVELSLKLADRERLLGAWVDGRCVGSAGAFTFELSVPGASLACGGVTWVGVAPTHRRRGILTALMTTQLAQIRERGEAIAALWASEAPIYGRFGYGLAMQQYEEVRLARVHAQLRGHPGARGRARLVDRAEALATWPAAWEAARAQRAGLHSRTAAWWEVRVLPEQDRPEAGWSPAFLVSLEDGGETIGYVRYRVKRGWRHGLAAGELEVLELVGVDGGAEAALWEYVFGVDLIETVAAHNRPFDEPLFGLLEDPRRLERYPVDALFCRVLDPAAALEGRRYGREGRLVFEVVDDFGGYAGGRFVLEGGPDGARCRPTGETAMLTLPAEELGALYLGQASALALWRAGRVEGSEAAARAAELLFRWHPEPWAPEIW